MKVLDAITRAINEFENDNGEIYLDKETSLSTLERFGNRVLKFYKIPYSKNVKPLNGGKQK